MDNKTSFSEMNKTIADNFFDDQKESGEAKCYAAKRYIEDHMTDDDVETWHSGDGMTEHMAEIMKIVNEFCGEELVPQVYGGNGSSEPLNVIL